MLHQAMDWLRADSWLFRLWAALFGAVTASAIILALENAPHENVTSKDLLFLALSSLGAALAGFLMSGWFGREGLLGTLLTLLAAWISGGLAGVFVGTVFALLKGMLLGAALGATAPFISLSTGALWIICCTLLHVAIWALRRRSAYP